MTKHTSIAPAVLLLSVLALSALVSPAHGQVSIFGSTTRLTTDPAAQFDPSISGNIVVYADLRNGNADIYYVDVTTGIETRVTTGSQDEQLNDVSGNTIVYTDFGATTGGGDIKAFTIGGITRDVAVSPTSAQKNPGIGGSIVAWEDTRDGNQEIYAKDLTTGVEKRLTTTPSATEMDPAVSGSRVAYSRQDATGCQIFVTDFVTVTTTQVTSAPACHSLPDISGTRVVYHGNRDGNQDIFTYDLTSGIETRLTLSGAQRDANVAGDWVAFEDVSSGNSDIKLYHVPSGSFFTAATTPSNEFLNDIDGTRVAYTTDVGGNLDIYMFEFSVSLSSGELLGVPLPSAISAIITQGGPPNNADTYVTPYVATQAGTITSWKAQFIGGNLLPSPCAGGPGVPAGIQLKVMRQVSTNVVQVISAGSVHDPRPILRQRFGTAYPFFLTEESVIEFTDPGLTVLARDIIGVTIKSDPAICGYFYPLVSRAGTCVVLRDVPAGGTIDLTDPFTGTLAHAPALQVNTGPDTTPPDTTVTSAVDGNGAPVANGGSTPSTSITFTFTGTDNVGVTGFECSLDDAVFSACTSPKSSTGLSTGSRTFQVRAKDAAGNVDPTPAAFTWTILTPAQAIQNLINVINSMNLPMGVRTSLLGPLNGAITLLTDNDPNNDVAVCGKLTAFINEVNAKQANGQLTEGQADQLRQLANAIKVSLGCP